MGIEKNTRRSGLTFVEVLVSIFVILFLMFLLLPMVCSARPAARRSFCCNNLRQLSIAVATYADSFGMLPSAVNDGPYMRDADGNRVYTYGQRFSAFVPLLPYLDTRATYEKLRLDQTRRKQSKSRGHA